MWSSWHDLGSRHADKHTHARTHARAHLADHTPPLLTVCCQAKGMSQRKTRVGIQRNLTRLLCTEADEVTDVGTDVGTGAGAQAVPLEGSDKPAGSGVPGASAGAAFPSALPAAMGAALAAAFLAL